MDIVLNWLWQGGAIALAAAVGLRIIPTSRPQARYAFIWVAYAVVLALPAASQLLTGAPAPSPVDPMMARDPAVSIPVAWWTSSALMLGLWLAWFGTHAVKLAAAAIALRTTKRECLECPPELEARLPLWSRVRSTGRQTCLVVSSRVRSAAVLGCGEPVIALAPVLLERLDPSDLDRVVLHEWSHVQRRDDRAQLVQQALHTAIGWHPAVWWLERQLTLEREAACDLAAVTLTGSAKHYAACLATLAALPAPPVRLISALAAASPSGLRQRVIRILSHGIGDRRAWRAIAVFASLALLPIALAVGRVQIVEAGLAPGQPPATLSHAIVSTVSAPALPLASQAHAPSTVSLAPLRQPATTAPAQSPRRSNRQPSGRQQEPNTPPIAEPSHSTAAALPPQPALQAEARTDIPLSTLVGTQEPSPLPITSIDAPPVEVTGDDPAADRATGLSPWSAAAEAGLAIGRGSQRAGVKTAGFFSRLGKTVAGSF